MKRGNHITSLLFVLIFSLACTPAVAWADDKAAEAEKDLRDALDSAKSANDAFDKAPQGNVSSEIKASEDAADKAAREYRESTINGDTAE